MSGLFHWLVIDTALFCCCCLCITSDVFAQEPTDTTALLAKLANAKADTARAGIQINLSVAFATVDVTKEYYYANEALALSEKAQWYTGIMLSESRIGDCYNKILAYSDAITHFRKSLTIATRLNRIDVQAYCLQLMIYAYRSLDSTEQVFRYQRRLLEIYEKTGDADKLCRQMRAYGLFLSEAGRYRECVNWLYKAINFADTHFSGSDKKHRIADMLNIMGGAYLKINGAGSALQCLSTAADFAHEVADSTLSAYIISTFCDVYMSIHNYDSAIIYGLRAVDMGRMLNNIDLQQYYYNVLSLAYEGNGDPASALACYKRHDSLVNILSNTSKTVNQAMQLAKINIEQQADRNLQEKKSFDIIRRNQQTALVAAFTALAALAVAVIFIYLNLRQKQKANKTISQQAAGLQAKNDIIDHALKEKEVLLKEIHHRVKNNLQLINSLLELQVAGQENEAVRNALRTAQRRVQSIATVHSKLYGNNDDTSIELGAFVNDLFMRINAAFGSETKPVHFSNTIPLTELTLNSVVLLGLILNELITNSFKYAYTGIAHPVITTSLRRDGGTIILEYRDNGIGMPEAIFNEDTGGLGLQIVKRLSKQLKGTTTYRRDNGSTFIITFPNAGN